MSKWILLIVCLCQGAFGQSIRVTENLSSDTVYVGDTLVFEIAVTVEGSMQIGEPVLPNSPDFELRSAGSTTSTQSIFGNSQMTQRFRYRVRPTRLGTLTIPSATVRVGSEERRTKPVIFEVLEPEETDAFDFVLEPESTSVYVGQPVRLRLAWYLYQSSVRGYEMLANIPDGVEVYPIDPRGERRGAQLADMRFNGQILTAWVEENVSYNGRTAMGVYLEVTLVPRDTGPLMLDSFAVVADLIVNSGSRLRASQTQKAIARAAPIELDVRPLPTAGRPDTFEGLIGSFEITANADQNEVNVGDPIDLRVTIRGPEPLQRIGAPDLSKQSGFDAFKLSSEGWKEVLTSGVGERVFCMTIRARNDAITEIPSIE
ncbi:MAG: BatD family protein, partial [Phycisphaerales bacterium]|nr:BatD family protein [Phycisphaerales bacterium]